MWHYWDVFQCQIHFKKIIHRKKSYKMTKSAKTGVTGEDSQGNSYFFDSTRECIALYIQGKDKEFAI